MKRKKCKEKSEAKMQITPALKFPTLYEELQKVIPEKDPLMILKPEIEEEFHAVIDTIKHEEPKITVGKLETLFTEPTELSVNNEAQKSEQSFEFCKVLSELIDNNHLPSVCRLCATQNSNMIYMLDSNKLYENIIEKIDCCLPIVVRETDNLPKQACQMCLAKLELCYQFRNSVAEAEKQLLISSRQTLGKLEETEEYCQAFSLYNEPHDARETVNDNKELEIFSESDTSSEELLLSNTIVEDHIASLNSKLHLEGLFPTETYPSDNFGDDRNTNDLNNEQEITDTLHSGKTSAFLHEQSSCYSALNSPMHVEYSEEAKSNDEVSDFKLEKLNNSPRRDSGTDSSNDDILFCEKEFDAPSLSDKTVKCRICGATFENTDECYLHTSEHESKNHYPCCLCEKTLTTEGGWRKHYLKHTEDEKSRRAAAVATSCDESENKFITQLKQKFYKLCHKSSAKPESISAEQIRTQENPNAGQKKNDRAAECTLCKKKFHPDLLKAHKEICGTQPFHFRRSLISAQTKKKHFSCAYCGKTFTRKQHVARHIQTHTRYQEDCTSGKHSSHMKDLQHRTKQKQGELSGRYYSFECTACDERFNPEDPQQIQVHLESCSEPIIQTAKLSCPDCKKEFDQEEDLATHMVIHTDNPPYGCNFCTLKFEFTFLKDEHQKIHIGRNLYKCSICEMALKSWSELKLHAKIHSKKKTYLYSCRICSKKFDTRIATNNHAATHPKSGRCRSNVCGIKVATGYDLRKHERNQHEEIADKN